jgi:hypothetical protein
MKKTFILFAWILFIASSCFARTIDVTNFSLKQNSGQIEITWSCWLPYEKYSFVIEKSVNAVEFKVIDTVYFKLGQESFLCIDNAPSLGIIYYQLKCLKQNGELDLSLISDIEFKESDSDQSFTISNIFPVPCLDHFSINVHTDKEVRLSIECYNTSGILMFKRLVSCSEGDTIIKIENYEDLIDDSYYITVSNGYLYKRTMQFFKQSNY